MNMLLPYWLSFFVSNFKRYGFDSRFSYQLNKAAMRCFLYLNNSESKDIKRKDLSNINIELILGIYSSIISYNDSISCLCYVGHGLNSSNLVRIQLEAYLIFHFLVEPKDDLKEIKQRVNSYEDWVMVKMYQNSKKSKNFELFKLDPGHDLYLKQVEGNYYYVKEKYNQPDFKKIEDSNSFIRDKRSIAKACGIEDLYQAVFSETSASVHIADISDRMSSEKYKGMKRYIFEIRSNKECMMMSGISNQILTLAISDFVDFFDYPKVIRQKILRKIKKS